MCKRSDKVCENFVQYFHILLPSVEVLRNKHAKFANISAYKTKTNMSRFGSELEGYAP